jgi:hypothetical protein
MNKCKIDNQKAGADLADSLWRMPLPDVLEAFESPSEKSIELFSAFLEAVMQRVEGYLEPVVSAVLDFQPVCTSRGRRYQGDDIVPTSTFVFPPTTKNQATRFARCLFFFGYMDGNSTRFKWERDNTKKLVAQLQGRHDSFKGEIDERFSRDLLNIISDFGKRDYQGFEEFKWELLVKMRDEIVSSFWYGQQGKGKKKRPSVRMAEKALIGDNESGDIGFLEQAGIEPPVNNVNSLRSNESRFTKAVKRLEEARE